MLPLTVPQAATAIRPGWHTLPTQVRAVIEAYCGAPVVAAESMGAGFTPSFASRLQLSDGRRVFVKAADDATRRLFANSHREEIRNLRVLGEAAPAAQLLWSHDADGWVAMGLEDIDGGHPERPWQVDQLELVLSAVDAMADALTPPPARHLWIPLVAALDDDFWHWRAAVERGYLPTWLRPRVDECTRLSVVGAEALAGRGIVHSDIRDDNILIDAHGSVWILDWSMLSVGNPVLDSVTVLISAHGDGHDSDRWLARCQTARGVDPEAIDGTLSLLASFFWTTCRLPTPQDSPWLRAHQRWYAEATSDWLAKRRGWR